jgi:hypothetical protein
MLVLFDIILFLLGIVPAFIIYDPLPRDFEGLSKDWIADNLPPLALNAICENLGSKPLAMLNEKGHWVGCMAVFK